MRLVFLLIITIPLLESCIQQNNQLPINFKEAEVSFSNGWDEMFSLKLIGLDTLYIRDGRSGELTLRLLKPRQSDTLNNLLSKLNINDYDSAYTPKGVSISDCGSWRLHLITTLQQKTIFTYCGAPEPLQGFVKWLVSLKESTTPLPVNTAIDFSKTSKGFYHVKPKE